MDSCEKKTPLLWFSCAVCSLISAPTPVPLLQFLRAVHSLIRPLPQRYHFDFLVLFVFSKHPSSSAVITILMCRLLPDKCPTLQRRYCAFWTPFVPLPRRCHCYSNRSISISSVTSLPFLHCQLLIAICPLTYPVIHPNWLKVQQHCCTMRLFRESGRVLLWYALKLIFFVSIYSCFWW